MGLNQSLNLADNVGAIIHFGMQTFVPRAQRTCGGWHHTAGAHASTFNPTALDTDDWVRAAASFGAKYVVLVTDHFSGFSLYPTAAHNYSVAASPWRAGAGDVVADFVASCAKYDVRPGYYYSVHENWHYGVCDFNLTDAAAQAAFETAALLQLTELQARFPPGDTAELWFDAGVKQGGEFLARVNGFVDGTLPRTATCHSCQNLPAANQVSWMGNEETVMPYPLWNANDEACSLIGAGGRGYGEPGGTRWCPAHCDAVLRRHFWFWDAATYNASANLNVPSTLLKMHLTSVGRGCNMILDMSPTTAGLLQPNDAATYGAFGAGVGALYGSATLVGATVAPAAGAAPASVVEIAPVSGAPGNFPARMSRGAVELREDMSLGQTICAFQLQYQVSSAAGSPGAVWQNVTGLQNERQLTIGNRRILTWFAPLVGAARFRVVLTTLLLSDGPQQPPAAAPARLMSAKIFDWSSATLDPLLVDIERVK